MNNKLILTALNYYINKSGDVSHLFYDQAGLASLASARLQMLPALIAAQHLGAKAYLMSFHSSEPQLLDKIQKSDICLIGKLSANTDALAHSMIMANLAATTRLKNQGAKIVLQYCDHHISRPETHPLRKLYEDLFCLADHVVYPTKTLERLTRTLVHSNAKQHVIHDPWQISKQYPHRYVKGIDTFAIIWFGSSLNAIYLLTQLKNMISKQSSKFKFELTILTRPEAIEKIKKTISSLKIHAPNWSIRFVPWSFNNQPQQLEDELKRAHIAIIPSDPTDPTKMGVSHNRVVDAARAGCLVIASPMESYIELKNICMIGEDIGQLLQEATSNYNELSAKKNMACTTTLESFNPLTNITKWKRLWEEVFPGR